LFEFLPEASGFKTASVYQNQNYYLFTGEAVLSIFFSGIVAPDLAIIFPLIFKVIGEVFAFE